MSRLFIALDLAPVVRDAVQFLQPPRRSGLRLTDPSQLHLTLHFLGEAYAEPVRDLLQTVVSEPFTLSLAGTGSFPAGDRGLIGWVGVEEEPKLTALHGKIGQALLSGGFSIDQRPFVPHITLARAQPGSAAMTLRSHLDRTSQLRLPPQQIHEFSLYSSTFDGTRHVHQREACFPLQSAE